MVAIFLLGHKDKLRPSLCPSKMELEGGKLFTIVVIMPNFTNFKALINVGKSL
jgi:hypothetical protein